MELIFPLIGAAIIMAGAFLVFWPRRPRLPVLYGGRVTRQVRRADARRTGWLRMQSMGGQPAFTEWGETQTRRVRRNAVRKWHRCKAVM